MNKIPSDTKNFFVIPVKKLESRYLINKDGAIFDALNQCLVCDNMKPSEKKDRAVALEYAGTNGKISTLDSTIYQLVMLTFCGYLEADISLDEGIDYLYRRLRYINFEVRAPNRNERIINGTTLRRFADTEIFVSNDGLVYNSQKRDFYKYSMHPKGYVQVSLDLVHRLVYAVWNGELISGYHVHHKDGNPWNNRATNLQQLTPEEHSKIPNSLNIYSIQQIKELCEDMQNGMSPIEASRKAGVRDSLGASIRCGSAWQHIAKDYTFPQDVIFARPGILSPKDAEEIVELFKDGVLTSREIAEKYGVTRDSIQDIRNRRSWKTLTCKHVFTSVDPGNPTPEKHAKPTNATINEDQVREIWKCLQAGESMQYIASKLNIKYDIIKKIKYRYRWTSVTDQLGDLPGRENHRAVLPQTPDAQSVKLLAGSTTIESIAA